MSKLITVFGATGAQGGPVARALLQNGFKMRAVTRNTDSEKAKALRDAGAEVVAGSIDNRDSVKAAVAGAYGAFVVTPFLVSNEEEVGKAAADACKEAGLQHVVFSGLESVKDKIGKSCAHMDSKVAVEKYLDEIGVPNTSVRYPFYFENFLSFYVPAFKADGTYTLTMPIDGPMNAISVADGAPIVLAVFQNPQQYLGKKVAISGSRKKITEYTEIISKVTGKTVKYKQITFEQAANDPNNPAAEELSVMFEYFSKEEPSYDEEFTRKLHPGTLTFQQWAEQNKDKLMACTNNYVYMRY